MIFIFYGGILQIVRIILTSSDRVLLREEMGNQITFISDGGVSMRNGKKVKTDVPGNPYAYNVLQNLRDAGCTDDIVEKFMALQGHNDKEQQIEILFKHRKALLEELHREEKRIDCLDYLLYQMQSRQ